MPKGYHGESCAEAIRDSLKPGEVVTFSTLYRRVRKRGGRRARTTNDTKSTK